MRHVPSRARCPGDGPRTRRAGRRARRGRMRRGSRRRRTRGAAPGCPRAPRRESPGRARPPPPRAAAASPARTPRSAPGRARSSPKGSHRARGVTTPLTRRTVAGRARSGMSKPGSPVRVTRLRVEGRKARRAPVADRDAEASRFFDDPEFLRTALGERTDAASARDALDAARLARCAPGALILDAGCGPGCHALALARMGYRVVGLDRAAVLLAAGRRAVGGAPRL